MVRGIPRSGLDRPAFARAQTQALARPPVTAGTRVGVGLERLRRRPPRLQHLRLYLNRACARESSAASSGGAHLAQMVGPEDAGACSGRNRKLLPMPAPESAGQDGKTIRATGSFGGGGGVGAVEPPEEEEGEEEETPPQQFLRHYLAAAGGQLEPRLGYCPLPAGQHCSPRSSAAPRSDACPPDSGAKHRGAEVADGTAPRHGGMTNGDSGFLLGQDCRDLEESHGLARAGLRNPRHRRLHLEGPGDQGADGSGSRSDWAAPLEDPLRSCCLAAEETEGAGCSAGDSTVRGGRRSEDLEHPGAGARAGAGDRQEGASPATSGERTSRGAGAEPLLDFSDVHLNSRNTFEVSRCQRACDHLSPAGPAGPSSPVEQGSAGTAARVRRSGGFADFFARYSAG